MPSLRVPTNPAGHLRLVVVLDEAARRELSVAATLALLGEGEAAHREMRRIQMDLRIAQFPWMRPRQGFDLAAQPSLDSKEVRELVQGGSRAGRMSLGC